MLARVSALCAFLACSAAAFAQALPQNPDKPTAPNVTVQSVTAEMITLQTRRGPQEALRVNVTVQSQFAIDPSQSVNLVHVAGECGLQGAFTFNGGPTEFREIGEDWDEETVFTSGNTATLRFYFPLRELLRGIRRVLYRNAASNPQFVGTLFSVGSNNPAALQPSDYNGQTVVIHLEGEQRRSDVDAQVLASNPMIDVFGTGTDMEGQPQLPVADHR